MEVKRTEADEFTIKQSDAQLIADGEETIPVTDDLKDAFLNASIGITDGGSCNAYVNIQIVADEDFDDLAEYEA